MEEPVEVPGRMTDSKEFYFETVVRIHEKRRRRHESEGTTVGVRGKLL